MIKLSNTVSAVVANLLNRSEIFLATSFAGLIIIGALLLRLPSAQSTGQVGLLDALFTSTSAVCVTGLITVDTATAYSRFGQTVILILIQLGGLGIMSFAAVGVQILGSRLSFRSQALLHDSFYQTQAAASIRHDLARIFVLTMLIEAAGATLLYLSMPRPPQGTSPLFSSMFHAVSAFCNAGFSIHSDNLIGLRNYPAVLFTIMALIILGGLGHTVVLDAAKRLLKWILRRPVTPIRWPLNSRIVIVVSALLIVWGAIAIHILGLTPAENTPGASLIHALFHSVSARTAGFNTLDLAQFPAPTLLVIIALMFIGGSPASCAGGVKTTAIATWLAEVRARWRGQREVTLWGRRLPDGIIERSAAIIGLALIWNMLGVLLLSTTESGLIYSGGHDAARFGLEDLIFEQVSAFGTVGLSTGVTPNLSAYGKLWIIATMFMGRLGPLTLALAVIPKGLSPVRFPEERIMIG